MSERPKLDKNLDGKTFRAFYYLKYGDKNLGCNDAQKACKLGNCKTLESAQGIGLCR